LISKLSLDGGNNIGLTFRYPDFIFGLCCVDCVLPGAGAFEIAAYQELMKFKNEVKGRARLGKPHIDLLLLKGSNSFI
jgi:hypothetical protein